MSNLAEVITDTNEIEEIIRPTENKYSINFVNQTDSCRDVHFICPDGNTQSLTLLEGNGGQQAFYGCRRSGPAWAIQDLQDFDQSILAILTCSTTVQVTITDEEPFICVEQWASEGGEELYDGDFTVISDPQEIQDFLFPAENTYLAYSVKFDNQAETSRTINIVGPDGKLYPNNELESGRGMSIENCMPGSAWAVQDDRFIVAIVKCTQNCMITIRDQEPFYDVTPLDEEEYQQDSYGQDQSQDEIICGSINAVAEEIGADQNPEIKKAIDFINSVLAKGTPFEDPDFPACQASLITPECACYEDSILLKGGSFQWKRSSELFENPEVFKDGVDIDDIKQGQLGDCYFLATLVSSAEVPTRIQRRLLTKVQNKCGIYGMTFWVNGKETPVIVDDYFPCDEDDRPIIVSCKDQGEMWPLILNKGWAKLHGSYARIEGGWATQVSMHLTGLPAQIIKHSQMNDAEKLWKRMRDADSHDYSMHSSTEAHEKGDKANIQGLFQQHMYSLIECYEVESQGSSIRLVKLRNPHGATEWTGDWSDNSDKWTDEMKAQLNCEIKDDGIFYMSFEDFLVKFGNTSLCMQQSEKLLQQSFHVKDNQTGKSAAFFEFELQEDLDYNDQILCFMANQMGDRLKNSRLKKRKFEPSKFAFEVIDLSTSQPVDGFKAETDYERFNYFAMPRDSVLKAGKYLLCVFALCNRQAFNLEGATDSLVRVLSKTDLQITQLDFDAGKELWEEADLNITNGEWLDQQWDERDETGPMYEKEFFDLMRKLSLPEDTLQNEWFTAHHGINEVSLFDLKVLMKYQLNFE